LTTGGKRNSSPSAKSSLRTQKIRAAHDFDHDGKPVPPPHRHFCFGFTNNSVFLPCTITTGLAWMLGSFEAWMVTSV